MTAIVFDRVNKIFSTAKGAFSALNEVSFQVERGEFFGLLGPNGAGKTTLIQILAGLSQASSGRVRVMGFDVVADYAKARHALGIVPQELVFDPFFGVRECLTIQSGYFGLKHNEAWIDELLEGLGLADKAKVNMRQLSGGMKRRVLVAQALVHKPAVIVLDEPTAGVDVELRQSLWHFVSQLNRLGTTVMLTTHYLEEAQALCTRLAILKGGRILSLDSTSALLAERASTILRFNLDQALPAFLAGQARVTGRAVQIKLRNALEVEGILAQMRESGCQPHDLEIGKADLEDVFLDMMSDAQAQGQVV